MNPETIAQIIREALATAKAGFEFACTPQGQALIEQSLKDRARWDAFWADLAAKLTTGWNDLFRAAKPLP